MSLAVIGLSHHTAPVEVRERFAFSRSGVADALKRLLAGEAIAEAALVSTCNRTEMHLHLKDWEEGLARATDVLARQAGELPEPAESYLYVHRDQEAVRHLFRVISGLESMVVGEVEIQGQVKEAYEVARTLAGERAAVGRVFNRLFQTAFSVGGQVRSETRLSEGAASVPSAAVELARKIFGSLRGRRGMVMGAGEMGALTLQCLVGEGMENVLVASRHLDRADRLAREMGGGAVDYERFWDRLADVEILISATAAPHPVVTLDRFKRAAPREPKAPLFIVDIAMPRDVEPTVGEQPNVFLYTMDDLQQIVAANFERRRGEMPRAEAIVERGADQFWRWFTGLEAVPVIRRMREHGEQLRRQELERSLSHLGHLPQQDLEEVERLTRNLMRKLLHNPTARLRAAAEDGANRGVLEAARYLFDVEEKVDGEKSD